VGQAMTQSNPFAVHPDALPKNANIISTGYVPRTLQAEMHNRFKRFNVVVAHRRFGKSLCVINEMIDKALTNPLRNPHYAYIAPTYSAAERISWQYFIDYMETIPGFKANIGKLRIMVERPAQRDRAGAVIRRADTITIYLLGAENPDSIRGMYMDGVVLDEYGEMNPVIWGTIIRPCLSDREGWAIFIGTPKGRNSFFEMYEYGKAHTDDWYTAIFPASNTGIIPEKELASLREEFTEDEFSQEFLCSFTAALTGFYLSKKLADLRVNNRIGDVPHNPAKPVATFWDLGLSDDMSIWFAQLNATHTGYNIIDYMSAPGYTVEWWWKELQKLPYNYVRHYWPHDGGRREIVTGKERWLIAEALGMRNIEVVGRPLKKSDAIEAIRTILPMCSFDAVKCEKGIFCLENWQREWDSKNKRFKDNPKHDWASHGSDAFSTFALGVDLVYSFTDTNSMIPRTPVFAEADWDAFGE